AVGQEISDGLPRWVCVFVTCYCAYQSNFSHWSQKIMPTFRSTSCRVPSRDRLTSQIEPETLLLGA
ncbi:MAG TPA: hypothetical protein V6C90_19230, partial [Coleofasciculaceae cyanobacterium]